MSSMSGDPIREAPDGENRLSDPRFAIDLVRGRLEQIGEGDWTPQDTAAENLADVADALVREAAAKDERIKELKAFLDRQEFDHEREVAALREALRPFADAHAYKIAKGRKTKPPALGPKELQAAYEALRVSPAGERSSTDPENETFSGAQPAECDGSKFCCAATHIEGCFASAQPAEEQRDDTFCQIDRFSSRVCERGTKSCVRVHGGASSGGETP